LHTTPIWLCAGIASIWSLISIIFRVIKIINRRLKKLPAYKYQRTQFIRPILTIIIYLCVIGVARLSLRSAELYGIKIAKQIQAQCKELGTCPETIDGWDIEKDEYRIKVSKYYGEYGAKYLLSYGVYNDNIDFVIELMHHFEEGLIIRGGVNKELTAVICDSDDCKDVPIE